MQDQNSVLDKLVAELDAVTKHFMIQRGSHSGWEVSAFISADHTGPYVHPLPSGLDTTVCASGHGDTFASALDDVLGKIALAAPQAVSA